MIEEKETRRAARSRPWWRPGPRAAVEAAVLASAAAGLVIVRERNEFPRPMIRALRGGTVAEKTEALRGLAQFGRAGESAIPGLLDVLRGDPNPAIRRGSAFVLAAIARAEAGGEPFSLDLFLAGSEDPRYDRSLDGRPPAPPHPRAPEVAAGLSRAIGHDPDPTVRRQAMTSLGDLLTAALGLPIDPDPGSRPSRPGEEPTELEPSLAVAPWMREAAGAIAARAGSADRAESRMATAWTYADPASRVLIDDDRRADALVSGAAAALRAPEGSLDILIVKAAAIAVRGSADRRGAFLEALDRAMAAEAPAEEDPADSGGPMMAPFWAPGPGARPLHPAEHAVPFLMAGPTARELAEHPAVIDALSLMLERGGERFRTYALGNSGSPEPRFEAASRARYRDDAGRGPFQDATIEGMIQRSIRDEPGLLDLIGDRLTGPQWSRLISERGYWDDLFPILLDPARRPALPGGRPDEIAGILADLLDTVSEDEPSPRDRCLALLAYFARGTEPGSEARERFTALVEPMRDDLRQSVRERADRLLERVSEEGESP